jgi:hypothetical protein
MNQSTRKPNTAMIAKIFLKSNNKNLRNNKDLKRNRKIGKSNKKDLKRNMKINSDFMYTIYY